MVTAEDLWTQIVDKNKINKGKLHELEIKNKTIEEDWWDDETSEEAERSGEWDSMDEDEDWKEWWEHAVEDEEAEQDELKTAMEKLMKGKGKL